MIKYLKNPKVQQYTLELIFPIVGYVFFDWSLLIIIVFYLMDQLGSEVAFWFRLKFVISFMPKKSNALLIFEAFTFTLLYGIGLFWLLHIFMYHIYDCHLYFLRLEWLTFVKGEFLILFPVLFLLHYLKDKMEFYRTDEPYKHLPLPRFKARLVLNVSILAGIFLISGIWLIFKFHEIWLLILIPVLKLANDIFLFPKIQAYIFKKN